jgi:phospholipid/cholesterol/gamma-HCH transport system substrate-binding protein
MSTRLPLIRLVAFVSVTLLATALLTRTIQGFQDDGGHTYSAVFSDATRLQPNDDVRVAGVAVGRVSSVSLTKDALARVSFTVNDSLRLTTDSIARIQYRNLIGERYVALDVPAHGPPLRDGGTLPLAQTEPALDLTAVVNGFRPLFQGLDARSINTLSISLVRALQGEGGTIASLLSSTGSFGRAIARRDARIGALVTDLTTVLNEVNQRSRPFNRLVTHLDRFTGSLAADRAVVIEALVGIDRLSTATDTLLTRARPGLAGSIRGLRAVATRLARTRGNLNQKMHLLPVKLNAIMRAAQYGSWFQFYNCGLGLEVNLLKDQPPLAVPPNPPDTEICGQ